MKKHRIAVVGAGRVGTAFISIMEALGILETAELHVLDSWKGPLQNFDNTYLIADDPVDEVLRRIEPTVVICCTPFTINKKVAAAAAELKAHYIDFTEDNEVTEFIQNLVVEDSTFIPQTGLAPGLVSYLGHSLFKNLGCQPWSLDLRVGALPQVSFGPAHYAITWSPEGLINEYIKTAKRKRDGVLYEISPLVDREEIIVNGVLYEGFTTSGGVGLMTAYKTIPNVEYKTLRHPGHLAFMRNLLDSVGWDLQKGVELARSAFAQTRDDVVVVAAHAMDDCMRSASAGIHFYPDYELGLTALELTTAGTGVAVLQLLLQEESPLPKGILDSSQIPIDKLGETTAMKRVLAHGRP